MAMKPEDKTKSRKVNPSSPGAGVQSSAFGFMHTCTAVRIL